MNTNEPCHAKHVLRSVPLSTAQPNLLSVRQQQRSKDLWPGSNVFRSLSIKAKWIKGQQGQK